VDNVLGSARTGLIFTRIQEGAQPGGLTQPHPGQSEPGIPYHVPSGWVLVGGARRGGNSLAAGEGSAAVRSRRAVLFCWFVLYIPLFCIVVVAVPFVCCSVKLPLSRPTDFYLFRSILLHTPAGGGAAAWRLCCRLQTKPEHEGRACYLYSHHLPKAVTQMHTELKYMKGPHQSEQETHRGNKSTTYPLNGMQLQSD